MLVASVAFMNYTAWHMLCHAVWFSWDSRLAGVTSANAHESQIDVIHLAYSATCREPGVRIRTTAAICMACTRSTYDLKPKSKSDNRKERAVIVSIQRLPETSVCVAVHACEPEEGPVQWATTQP